VELELRNRQQLAAFAVSHGLITDIRGADRFGRAPRRLDGDRGGRAQVRGRDRVGR